MKDIGFIWNTILQQRNLTRDFSQKVIHFFCESIKYRHHNHLLMLCFYAFLFAQSLRKISDLCWERRNESFRECAITWCYFDSEACTVHNECSYSPPVVLISFSEWMRMTTVFKLCNAMNFNFVSGVVPRKAYKGRRWWWCGGKIRHLKRFV